MKYLNLPITIIKWAVFFILHFFMIALTYVLSPILPAFAIGKEVLPKWLSWFQTPRDPLSGGEFFWSKVHPNIKSEYIIRILWLCRNPGYGFANSVLATRLKDGTKVYHKGDPLTHELHPGWVFIWTEDWRYFQLKVYKPTFKGRILKFRTGWKLASFAKTGVSAGHRRKYLFTCNPFKEARHY